MCSQAWPSFPTTLLHFPLLPSTKCWSPIAWQVEGVTLNVTKTEQKHQCATFVFAPFCSWAELKYRRLFPCTVEILVIFCFDFGANIWQVPQSEVYCQTKYQTSDHFGGVNGDPNIEKTKRIVDLKQPQNFALWKLNALKCKNAIDGLTNDE